MALTKISGNQISPTTEAIIEALSFTSADSILRLPSGDTANQPTGISFGTIRYNTELDAAEIYVADTGQGSPGWDDVGGGGTSLGDNGMIRTNTDTIQETIDIDPNTLGDEFTNAFMAGPVTIAQGYEVIVRDPANFYIIGEDADQQTFSSVLTTNIDVEGLLHFSETKEQFTSFVTSGNVTHDYRDGATLLIEKTEGGNFTLSITNVPTSKGIYTVSVIMKDAGSRGFPTSLNVNGTGQTLYWAGGSSPSMGDDIGVCTFAIVAHNMGTTNNFHVLGSAANYG